MTRRGGIRGRGAVSRDNVHSRVVSVRVTVEGKEGHLPLSRFRQPIYR